MNDSQIPKLTRTPELAGIEHTMWGRSRLTLYGSPDAPQVWAETPMRGTVTFNVDRDALVRFAREVLTWAGEDNGVQLPPWQPANNGTGARIWFLIRGAGADSDRIPAGDRYHFSAAGILVRYASMESALRAADKLNARELASLTPTS